MYCGRNRKNHNKLLSGIEPENLFLTKEALYLLSYSSKFGGESTPKN